MRHHNSLIHGLLKPMPWGAFDRLLEKHAQLSGATSLREIEATTTSHATRLYHLGVKAPKRSTLADADGCARPMCSSSCFKCC
jgi:Domain of unknown function (DUF4372)